MCDKKGCGSNNRKALELLCEAIRCLEAACDELKCGDVCSVKEHICWGIEKAQESCRHIC